MKFNLIFLFAFVALVNCEFYAEHFGGNPPRNIQKTLDNVRENIETNINNSPFASDYELALQLLKTVESYVEPLVKNNVARKKRQATSVNCTVLESNLSKVQGDIILSESKITNATITLTTIQNQVKSYEAKVASSTGSALTSAKNLLSIYKKLESASITTLANLKKQLATQESDELRIRNDIVTYCTGTTTQAPIPDPCGTFVPYNPSIDQFAPTTDGFAGGVYQNSVAYVGFGDGTSCFNQYQAPCAISTSISPYGCHIPCGSNEVHDTNTAYYLKSHQDLTWFEADSSTVSSIQNVIRILGPNNFAFGRTKIGSDYVLGKIISVNGVYSFETVANNAAVKLSSGFEVLTCQIPGVCSCGGVTTSAPTTASTEPPTSSTTSTTSTTSTSSTTSTTTPETTSTTSTTTPETTSTTSTSSTTSTTSTTTPETTSTTSTTTPETTSTTSTTTPAPTTTTSTTTTVSTTVLTELPPQLITSATGCGVDTLSSGQSMNSSSSLSSSNGQYQMSLSNGDLRIKNAAGEIVWSSNTTGSGAVNLTMSSSGSMDLYNASGALVWSSAWYTNNTMAGSSLQITNTGQFYIFNGQKVSFSSSSVVVPVLDLSKYPCGTFMKYDTVNQKNFPELYGFAGGVDYDSSIQYVGYGDNSLCGLTISTGFILVDPAGAYMSCEDGLKFDNAQAYFLLKNDNLQWVSTDSASANAVDFKLAVNDAYNSYFFGRTSYLNEYRLGRFLQSGSVLEFTFTDENNQQGVFASNFQILTCRPQSTTVVPTQAPTNPPTQGVTNPPPVISQCGQLLFLSQYSPATYGFSAGTYMDGSTVYAGTGSFPTCLDANIAPARVMTSNGVQGPGSYMSCYNTPELYDATNSQFFAKHSDLRWIMTSASTFSGVYGKMAIGEYSGSQIFLGRQNITISNGTFVVIGKVWIDTFYYPDPLTLLEASNKNAFEILACSPCAQGSPPFCCANGAQNAQCQHQCGMTLPLSQYDPAVYGKGSGTYYDGSTIYPGAGSFLSCLNSQIAPARIMTSGAYASCYNTLELRDLTNPQFFVDHANLNWVATTGLTYMSVNGKIAIGEFSGMQMFSGRTQVTMANETFTVIGKIWNARLYYADPLSGIEKSTSAAFDILTCS